MKLKEIRNKNLIVRYSQIEEMTEEDVKNALEKGEVSFYLDHMYTGTAFPGEESMISGRYKLNIDNETEELILLDNLEMKVAIRGVDEIRNFMIANDFGLVADIIELEK